MSLLLDNIIEKLGPTEDSFEIGLPTGDILKFKSVTDIDELKGLKDRAANFLKMIEAGRYPEAWREFIFHEKASLGHVFCLGELSLDGLGHLDFLRIGKKVPVVFSFIVDQFERNISGRARLE